MTQPVRTTSSVEPDDHERRWRRLHRFTGIAGLAFLGLVMVPIVAASGQEPGFEGRPTPY